MAITNKQMLFQNFLEKHGQITALHSRIKSAKELFDTQKEKFNDLHSKISTLGNVLINIDAQRYEFIPGFVQGVRYPNLTTGGTRAQQAMLAIQSNPTMQDLFKCVKLMDQMITTLETVCADVEEATEKQKMRIEEETSEVARLEQHKTTAILLLLEREKNANKSYRDSKYCCAVRCRDIANTNVKMQTLHNLLGEPIISYFVPNTKYVRTSKNIFFL